MNERPHHAYPVQKLSRSNVPDGQPMIFGAADRAAAFGFGANRDKSNDARRVTTLRRGDPLLCDRINGDRYLITRRRLL